MAKSYSYTQPIGGNITLDLRIPVPLVSSECDTTPAFLLRRSGPVTTSVHRIPYNSPCSQSRKLYKVTAFPTCPSCVRIQAIFAERPPRPSDWNPLPDASSRTLTYFCVHGNGKRHFQKVDLTPTSSSASFVTHPSCLANPAPVDPQVGLFPSPPWIASLRTTSTTSALTLLFILPRLGYLTACP